MPIVNWATAAWIVFASRTVSLRRNRQPALSSFKKPADSSTSASSSALRGRTTMFDRRTAEAR